MESGLINYIVALAGFGTASGIDILAQRRFFPLTGGAHAIASVAGLADIALIIGAFFLLPIGSAIAAILIGGIATAILASALPPAPGWVIIFGLVGAVASAIYFM